MPAAVTNHGALARLRSSRTPRTTFVVMGPRTRRWIVPAALVLLVVIVAVTNAFGSR